MLMNTRDNLLTVLAALILSVTAGAAEEARISPHSRAGACAVCHVAPEDALRGWFVFGSTKREMKDDLNQLCLKCHTIKSLPPGSLGVTTGHATGKKPAANRENLPLSSDGTINCATTCHNMHLTSNDSHQQRMHLRLPADSLCMSCHDR